MNEADLVVEMILGNIEERASGIFLKVLDSGREVYTCKCPVCGTLHGGYNTFDEAWTHRKCKEHFRKEIEKTKKDLEKVDEPEKERNIFDKPMRKPKVLGEELEGDEDLVKDVAYENPDRIAYEIYRVGSEFLPVSRTGLIGRQGWKVDQLSGDWKIVGFRLDTGDYMPWPELKRKLDAGQNFTGYPRDMDHGTMREWGNLARVYKLGLREAEEEDDVKSLMGGQLGDPPGEVSKFTCNNLRRGQLLYHRTEKYRTGEPKAVRVSGRCITWKTRPNEFRIPVKFGLYQSFYITHDSAGDWSTTRPLRPGDPGSGSVAEGWPDFQPALDADVERGQLE